MGTHKTILTALLLGVVLCLPAAHAMRVGDLCQLQGADTNTLKGVGIVVGLSGTGDSNLAALMAQERMLERLDIDVNNLKELSTDNTAIVMVTATLLPFSKSGTRIDVTIDSLYDAESLEGGRLMETHLYGPGLGDTVYAVAQGGVSVGGFGASGGGGNSIRKNHITAARVPMGGTIVQDVPATITDGERILLLLKRPDFNTANQIQTAIDALYGEDISLALGAGSIRVTIPKSHQQELVSFIAQLQDINVKTSAPAKVIINEKTGTIVVGGSVMVQPCQVAHGSLTIKIATFPEVTPALPFTDANPVITETVELTAEETQAYLMPVEGTSAGDVAEALNRLQVTPLDMIAIFQALRESGALEADLEIM